MAFWTTSVGAYPDAGEIERSWGALADEAGARASVAGWSVEGRAIPRYDFGNPGGATVLLTGLIHAVEVIGSLALFDVVRSLVRSEAPLLKDARLVVLPIVNPDSVHANSARLAAGQRAYRRGNARGVDLNRNFPRLSRRTPLHPFAGSRFRASPHFTGPHPFSEPESCAVRDVARDTRPALSIGFHSFGDLLLYPWAVTAQPNPRAARYRRAGDAFRRAQPRKPYDVMQARRFYATVGDLDDWLDAELGTLAYTVEVSDLSLDLLRPARLFNPFCWMNPRDIGPTLANLTPGVAALLEAGLA
jgi:predicted deacylase